MVKIKKKTYKFLSYMQILGNFYNREDFLHLLNNFLTYPVN